MSGKSLLTSLLASCGLSAAATAQAGAVASGKPDLSADDQTAGTAALEQLVAAAHLQGSNEGRKAERERFGSVLTNPETTGQRLGLAITQLSTTDNTPEQVMACIKTVSATVELSTTEPPKGAEQPGQRQAKDPLATGADPIERATPLVDPGKPGAVDGPDEKAIASLWKGAIDSTSGIAGNDVWGGVFGTDQQRPN